MNTKTVYLRLSSSLLRLLVIAVLTCIFLIAAFPSEYAMPTHLRKVVIASFDYNPGIFRDSDGIIKGFYTELFNEIAAKEGWEIEYVHGSWTDGLERLKKGEVDIVTSAAKTADRMTYMDYTDTPVLGVWAEVYTSKQSPIKVMFDLNGKIIAVMKKDFNAIEFRRHAASYGMSCTYLELDGFDDVMHAIETGRADAGVINSTYSSMKSHEYEVRNTGIVLNPFDIYFTVGKGKNHDLLDTMNHYLSSWKSDNLSVYNIAMRKWLRRDMRIENRIPHWIKYAAAFLFSALLFVTVFMLILRSQVNSATKELRQSLTEKETLIKELYHRTKNNMQMICSMMSLQSKYSSDSDILSSFESIRERILAMALVHQKLYQSKNLSRIDLAEYIRELIQQIELSYNFMSGKVEFRLHLTNIPVLLDIAVPCGLVLNEMLTNIFKYSFPDNRTGVVNVELSSRDNRIHLSIGDDGVGLPEGFNPDTDGRMGMLIIKNVIEYQLQGTLAISNYKGLRYDMEFNYKLFPERI